MASISSALHLMFYFTVDMKHRNLTGPEPHAGGISFNGNLSLVWGQALPI